MKYTILFILITVLNFHSFSQKYRAIIQPKENPEILAKRSILLATKNADYHKVVSISASAVYLIGIKDPEWFKLKYKETKEIINLHKQAIHSILNNKDEKAKEIYSAILIKNPYDKDAKKGVEVLNNSKKTPIKPRNATNANSVIIFSRKFKDKEAIIFLKSHFGKSPDDDIKINKEILFREKGGIVNLGPTELNEFEKYYSKGIYFLKKCNYSASFLNFEKAHELKKTAQKTLLFYRNVDLINTIMKDIETQIVKPSTEFNYLLSRFESVTKINNTLNKIQENTKSPCIEKSFINYLISNIPKEITSLNCIKFDKIYFKLQELNYLELNSNQNILLYKEKCSKNNDCYNQKDAINTTYNLKIKSLNKDSLELFRRELTSLKDSCNLDLVLKIQDLDNKIQSIKSCEEKGMNSTADFEKFVNSKPSEGALKEKRATLNSVADSCYLLRKDHLKKIDNLLDSLDKTIPPPPVADTIIPTIVKCDTANINSVQISFGQLNQFSKFQIINSNLLFRGDIYKLQAEPAFFIGLNYQKFRYNKKMNFGAFLNYIPKQTININSEKVNSISEFSISGIQAGMFGKYIRNNDCLNKPRLYFKILISPTFNKFSSQSNQPIITEIISNYNNRFGSTLQLGPGIDIPKHHVELELYWQTDHYYQKGITIKNFGKSTIINELWGLKISKGFKVNK